MKPKTSIQAFKLMTSDIKANHHKSIIKALLKLKMANFEQIAKHLKWEDKNRVSRRMSELELDGIVYKPGTMIKTKSGRNSYVYSLTKKTLNKLSKK